MAKAANDKAPVPLFHALGRPGTSKHGLEAMDVCKVLAELSGKSARIFWLFVGLRDIETNVIRTDRGRLPPRDEKRISRAYKELEEAKLVVRLYRGRYLINPRAVLPKFEGYETVWSNWVQACRDRGVSPYAPLLV
ncbi:MAG: hypothetical protein U5O39_09905 [Gammaproteobacteria bacterium]|nr:hypothetical protein [Gammaproteobacteria bacterium]